ncbi:MAG: DUF4298 domain-containing protein [Atopobiaceae bacterium]|nr:DUF4298 domain-containing protein [Atopobiaceae bacterium]
MESAERVAAMEQALDQTCDAVDQMRDAVAELVDATDAIRDLSAYYGSQEWYQDRKADQRGKLPGDLRRGVLTEDVPYEALVDAREMALGMLEVATALLRAL